jgi:hypothetical protein
MLFVAVAAMAAAAPAYGTEPEAVKPNYELAERFSPTKVRRLVPQTMVRPNWFENSTKFWYQWTTVDGTKYYIVDPATGKLSNQMESEKTKLWIEKLYDAVVTNPCIVNKYAHATTAGSGIAMSSSDCDPYNFYHTYQELSNGDIIRAVPRPTRYAGEDVTYACTTWMFAVPKNSDEPDAAVDLLTYICKAGLKWMEDHSEGVFETEYEGIIGATDYSAAWLEKYNEFLEERHEKYDEIKGMWDVEFNATMMQSYKDNTKLFGGSYAGMVSPWQGAKGSGYDFSSLYSQPPASSIPVLSKAMENLVNTYNSLYVF